MSVPVPSLPSMPCRPAARCCAAVLVAGCVLALPVAQATPAAKASRKAAPPAPKLYLDIGTATAAALVPLSTRDAAPLFKPGHVLLEPDPQPADYSLAVVGDALAADAARFSEMVGSHRIEWHYSHDWSSSLGTDYPRLRSPSYFVGNGAPGVDQRVWFRFSFLRRF